MSVSIPLEALWFLLMKRGRYQHETGRRCGAVAVSFPAEVPFLLVFCCL